MIFITIIKHPASSTTTLNNIKQQKSTTNNNNNTLYCTVLVPSEDTTIYPLDRSLEYEKLLLIISFIEPFTSLVVRTTSNFVRSQQSCEEHHHQQQQQQQQQLLEQATSTAVKSTDSGIQHSK